MKITSQLSASEYLSALKKRRFRNPDEFEKLSVHTAGSFFAITKRKCVSGWNVSQRFFINSAYGYVRNTEYGCDIRFLRTYGPLNHLTLLLLFPVCALLCALVYYYSNMPFLLDVFLITSGMLSIIVLFVFILTSISESISECSEWSTSEFMVILSYPELTFDNNNTDK